MLNVLAAKCETVGWGGGLSAAGGDPPPPPLIAEINLKHPGSHVFLQKILFLDIIKIQITYAWLFNPLWSRGPGVGGPRGGGGVLTTHLNSQKILGAAGENAEILALKY